MRLKFTTSQGSNRLAGPLILLALAAGSPDLLLVAHKGESLTDAQAVQLQASVLKSPDNAELHAQLLGYDLGRKANTRQARLADILWMIDQRTDDPITGSSYCQIDATDDAASYARGKAAWDGQVAAHPNDPKLLANAADYFSTADFNAADALLQQTLSLEPKNADWPERVAQLYEKRFTQHPDDVARLAPAALEFRQSAYNLTKDPKRRFVVLVQMPRDAFLAQDLISAKRFARQLVATAVKFKTDPAYGDAIYWGNIVQGEIAMHENKIDEAEEFLQAAGATPGSPTLATVGPDFKLAKDLLAKGERTPVHDYLVACKKFWTAGSQRLDAWIETLNTGGTPDM